MGSAIAATPLTSVIFIVTYMALAVGKIPRLQVDRAGIALIGAVAMLVFGLTDLHAAALSVDFHTIALLLGMMILVAYLQIGGFFQAATELLLRLRLGPYGLLAMTIGLSGLLSAFLVNDVVCVALTPLILDVCKRSKQPAMPHLIGLATASNVGSVATITGNPQNMIIGSLSGMSYAKFAASLAPVAAFALLINFALVALIYRRQISAAQSVEITSEHADQAPIDYTLLAKGAVVTIGVIALFFAGAPIATVALGAAAIMLLSSVPPDEVYRRIDWPLLMMFAGLFILVHVFNVHVVRGWAIEDWKFITESPVAAVSGLSIVLSNLVSNVPAVLLFQPIVEATSNPEKAWLALAMSSTFAGNLTVLGSVANLIVVENARRSGIEVSFWEYLKVGAPVTILTTVLGVFYLQWWG